MCGRFTLVEINKLFARYSIPETGFSFLPRYNISPSQNSPIILREENKNKLTLMRWGLIPHWAKDIKIGYKMINARAETITEKPAYRSPFQKRRCIIPADSFYEWKKVGDQKFPQRILPKTREVFGMAGIWDKWKGPDNKELFSFSIITTGANAMMNPIHERMPVILDKEGEEIWLNPETPKENLLSILKPCPEDYLESYEVSRKLNSPTNDSQDLIQAIQ